MVVYFRSYVILICAIAVALPVAYSTVYPMLTGNLAASSLMGLISMFVLFVLGLMLGFGIFERKAQAKADSWVSLYNNDCDPEAFIKAGADLAASMKIPYNQVSSWFMSYYAQARLDMGDRQDAKEILEGMLSSIDVSKKPAEKIGILVNAVPLMEKIRGPEEALNLINNGMLMCSGQKNNIIMQYREFLESQHSIMQARIDGDYSKLAQLDEAVWTSSRYPRRIRVEYAWDGASADYKAGDAASERKALQYVEENGGSLALVGKARSRLSDLKEPL